MLGLTDLPDEMLYHIFKYLPKQEVFWNVGYTCTYLHSVAVNFTTEIELELSSQYDKCCKGQASLNCYKDNTTANQNFCNQFSKLFDDENVTSRICYLALGKCYGSVYEDQILDEIEQIKREFCHKLSDDGFSTKVCCSKFTCMYSKLT